MQDLSAGELKRKLDEAREKATVWQTPEKFYTLRKPVQGLRLIVMKLS